MSIATSQGQVRTARTWMRFLYVQLPIALLALALLAEGCAAMLTHVRPRRHTVDDLVAALHDDPHNPPVVLLGDSLIHNVSRDWRLGQPDTLANLSSHAESGLISEYFLLARYLASGRTPRAVLLVATPDLFTLDSIRTNFDFYIASTFRNPNEQAILRQLYPQYLTQSGWAPAALKMESRIASPLFSLVRSGAVAFPIAARPPAAELPPEQAAPNIYDARLYAERAASNLTILAPQADLLARLCQLSLDHGFRLTVALPPIAPELLAVWQANGAMARLDAALGARLADHCNAAPLMHLGAGHTYRYFDYSSRHIRGDTDEQALATEVNALVR